MALHGCRAAYFPNCPRFSSRKPVRIHSPEGGNTELAVAGLGIILCVALLEKEGIGGELGLLVPDAIPHDDFIRCQGGHIIEPLERCHAPFVDRQHDPSVT